MQQLIQITECNPFKCKFCIRGFGDNWCSHPAFDDYTSLVKAADTLMITDARGGYIPSICPLREAPLVIIYRLELSNEQE